MGKHASVSCSDNSQIDRMARVMQERQAAAGACTEADLRAEGFTREDIERLAEHAAKRAQIQFMRRV